MTRTILTIFLTFFIQNMSFGYTRLFYMDLEIKESTLIKEIIILGYTSRIDTLPNQQPIVKEKVIDKMTYAFVDKPDSILTYSPPYTGNINSTPYYIIATKDSTFKPYVPEGYWPAIGDTVLVVFNSNKQVTLFAEIIEKASFLQYKFWSPYGTSSWNTIFCANSPFKNYMFYKSTDKYNIILQDLAKVKGYEFASSYHCIIKKNDFWTYLESIK